MHANVHALATQAAVALATLVVQIWPHVPQSLALVVVSTQLPLHSFGADGGQPATQPNAPASPDGEQSGAVGGQLAPHAPQAVLDDTLVGHPAPAFAQSPKPAAHWYEQVPPWQASPTALTWGRRVQSLPHAPQLERSVSDTHPPSHADRPAPQAALSLPLSTSEAAPTSPSVPSRWVPPSGATVTSSREPPSEAIVASLPAPPSFTM